MVPPRKWPRRPSTTVPRPLTRRHTVKLTPKVTVTGTLQVSTMAPVMVQATAGTPQVTTTAALTEPLARTTASRDTETTPMLFTTSRPPATTTPTSTLTKVLASRLMASKPVTDKLAEPNPSATRVTLSGEHKA